jgi:flagellar biosynthesis/type III secretory pathway M-ring protein FliF/YscJ
VPVACFGRQVRGKRIIVASWVWVAVVAGVLLAVALLVFMIGTPARRRAAKRDEAAELRDEAGEKLASAARREAAASQEEAAARRDRLAAEHAMSQADAVDPDLPDAPSPVDAGSGGVTEADASA